MQKQQSTCYNRSMNTYFENQFTYRNISFYLGNDPHISERELHAYHELILYMGDGVTFLCEGGSRYLPHGTLLFIPRETYHFFRLKEGESFFRMRIGIPDAALQKMPLPSLTTGMRIIEQPDGDLPFLLRRLLDTLKKGEERPFYAYSLLLVLLAELDTQQSATPVENMSSKPVAELIDYITSHLSDDLSVEVLSRAVCSSASSLTHTFKKEMGISLHEYITQKRLLYGRSLIRENCILSKIYSACGYHDYSAFYKAYVKFFGYPPSRENKLP